MFRPKRRETDFAAEIEAHLQLEEDRLRAEGLSADAARTAAVRAFGNRTLARERFYDRAHRIWWEGLLRDFRFAFRILHRERTFAAFVVVLIGLGAGLTTAMFALFDGVALRKLAVPDPDSLVHIVSVKNGNDDPIRYSIFERLRETLDLTESMVGTNGTLVPITYDSQTRFVPIQYVTGDYVRTMGARPILGRMLTPADDGPVAVISDAYWQRIGSDPNILGKTIPVGPVALTVIGVVPASSLEIIRFHKTDIAVPFRVGMILENVAPTRVPLYYVNITARLKPGVTREQVQQRLDALWPQLVAETLPAAQSRDEWVRMVGPQCRVLPGNRGWTWSDQSLPRVTLTLLLLSGLVSIAMCTNLAGLLLSRGLGKQKEQGLRLALGATRWHVVRYALVEVVILSCVGGAAAILLADWLIEVCAKALSSEVGLVTVDYGVKVDGRVIAFGLIVSAATAVAAQLIPALSLSGGRLLEAIKAGAQNLSARLGGRKAILVTQVAASIVLVSGSLLFVETLRSLTKVDAGFQSRGVLAVRLGPRVPWSEAEPEFFYELLSRVRAIPGVLGAGLANRAPMEWDFEPSEPIRPLQDQTSAGTITDRVCIWPGFFDPLQIPILMGRDFRESDRNMVILTRSLAQALFPGAGPLGQYLRLGKVPQAETYQVVGIVADVRFRSPRQTDTRTAFVPCSHIWKPPQTRNAMAMSIHVDGPTADVEAALRREVEAMGKQAVAHIVPLERLISESMRNEGTLSTIATGFGAFALILTCAGVYALIDLTATARRREFGIRMALGANSRKIVMLMLSGVARLITIGATVGLLLAYVMLHFYRTYLYGVAELEPLLTAGALGLVTLFALLAALVPAWRAAHHEPSSVLRL